MKTHRNLIQTALFTLLVSVPSVSANAKNPFTAYLPSYHERPTMNVTCDPRPNILPDELYNHHTPYRRIYNRPQDLVGYIAHVVEPTSQEAMSWWENKCAGRYDTKHAAPMCKRYYYPKPWEALNVEPRADYPKLTPAGSEPLAEVHGEQKNIAPTTVEAAPDVRIPAPLEPQPSSQR